MSQRPINLLEIKSNFSKAMTEASASFETIFADMAHRIRNLDDQVKVYTAEVEGLKAEATRLKAENERLKPQSKKVKPDDAITPKK